MPNDALVGRILELSQPLRPVPTGLEPALEAPPGLRAVLFDVYGTLVISGSGDISLASGGDREAGMRETLRNNGFPGLADSETPLHALFLELLEAARASRAAQGIEFPEIDIRDVWDAFLQHLTAAGRLAVQPRPEVRDLLAVDFECRVNPVWPMPGMAEVLAELPARGIRLGIVSNAQFLTPLLFQAFAGKSLPELGFDPLRCVWSYQEGEAKPSIRLFEKARGALPLRPEEVLYVGNDMRNDIWPARTAGFRAALFAGDQRSLRLREEDPRARTEAPRLVLGDLRQILDLLG